jgi:UDP-N-acetyl-2-amino-2-deoxyglucuronate dehydrogenase
MDEVKFAVVGCGSIGTRHLAVVDAEPRAKVVAYCDIDRARCQSLASLYPGVPWFTDFSEMLRATDADVINICTPHGLHAPMAINASTAGRHVLVEKPMALTARDCADMIAAAEQGGVRLMVVKQNRFNVPIALAQRALAEGRLGRVFMVEVNVLWNRFDEYYSKSQWRGQKGLEGGALYTQVSHFIDLLIWWFGDVVDAQALVATRNHNIEIEDCGLAHLRFQSGVIGTLAWTTCVYSRNYEGSITIIGEHGTIKIGGPYLNKIEHWDVRAYPLPDGIAFVDQPNSYGKYQGSSSNHDQVVSNVVRRLLNERSQVVEGDEGIKTIEAIEFIYAHAAVAPPMPLPTHDAGPSKEARRW